MHAGGSCVNAGDARCATIALCAHAMMMVCGAIVVQTAVMSDVVRDAE